MDLIVLLDCRTPPRARLLLLHLCVDHLVYHLLIMLLNVFRCVPCMSRLFLCVCLPTSLPILTRLAVLSYARRSLASNASFPSPVSRLPLPVPPAPCMVYVAPPFGSISFAKLCSLAFRLLRLLCFGSPLIIIIKIATRTMPFGCLAWLCLRR